MLHTQQVDPVPMLFARDAITQGRVLSCSGLMRTQRRRLELTRPLKKEQSCIILVPMKEAIRAHYTSTQGAAQRWIQEGS